MKNDLNNKIINMRRSNHHIPGNQIAIKLGTSRQNVERILKKAGLSNAGKPVRYLCNYCGRIITGDGKLFCSKQCHSRYHRVPVVCDNPNCGRLFYIPISQFMARLAKNPDKSWTCSRKCKIELRIEIFISSL